MHDEISTSAGHYLLNYYLMSNEDIV